MVKFKILLTRRRLVLAAILLGVLGALTLESIWLGGRPNKSANVSLSTALTAISDHKAATATIDSNANLFTVRLKTGQVWVSGYPAGLAKDLADQVTAAHVELKAPAATSPSTLTRLLPSFILMIFLIGIIVWYLRRTMNMGSLKGGGRNGEIPTDRYHDFAGYPQALALVQESIQALLEPKRYAALGARNPKGILLVGPPGTGKTLLARAAAGEAQIPMYAVAGSSFVEKIAGVGPARVRQLSKAARRHPHALFVIDELDAIGRHRGGQSNFSDSSERESTLNQILADTDGMVQGGNVLLIGTTNRKDLLDPALLRPGRFDRIIEIGPPDRIGRLAILHHYVDPLPHIETLIEAGIDEALESLARRTPNWTGADLANLVNETALIATRQGADSVGPHHFELAMADISMGPAQGNAGALNPQDLRIISYHEAGHTLAALVLKDHPDPIRIAVGSRGAAGAATWMDVNPSMLLRNSQAQAALVVLLAGRVAEEILLDGDITSGAADDLKSATKISAAMVCEWGMAPAGSLLHRSIDQHDQEWIEQQQQLLLNQALATCRQLLGQQYASELTILAEAVQDKGELDRDEIVQMLNLQLNPVEPAVVIS